MSSVELNFISRLPEEVSNLILLKLPIKSLLTCTCVCKTWNSFIKSPAFFSSHLNRAIASSDESDSHLCLLQICTLPVKEGRDSFFLRSKDQDLSARDRIHFPYIDEYGFQVLSSCNGLILLMHGRYNFDSCPTRFMLWNPVIRKSMIIYGGYDLMPVKAVGLGVDSKSGDFKVLIVIEYLGNKTTLKVQLYSLKANSWKRLPDVEAKYDGKSMAVYRGVTYLNGTFYFVARKMLTKPRLVIWEFDLSEEVFHEIMLPDCMIMTIKPSRSHLPASNHFHLLTCGESLAVLWFRETIREIQVWVMKEESWTQLSTIRLEGLTDSRYLHITGSVFTEDDRVLLSVGSYGNEAGRIFSHDLKSQETKEIVNTGKHNCVFLGDYVESLALLDKGNDLSSQFDIVSDDANDTSGNSSSSNIDFLMGPSASSYDINAWNVMDYWSEISFLLNPGIAYMEEDSDESVESDSGAGHSSNELTSQ